MFIKVAYAIGAYEFMTKFNIIYQYDHKLRNVS